MAPPATLPVLASSSVIATVGALVSTACTLCAAAVLALPAASLAALAATSTVTLPSNPAVGVTTSV